MHEVVGKIGEYDVLYIPERDCIFCKNTVVPYNVMNEILNNGLCRNVIPEKNLVITIDSESVTLGCLVTTKTNIKSIKKQIIKKRK